MAEISFKGKSIHTSGSLPALNTAAPDFILVDENLDNRTLADFKGMKKLIATAPSLDTGVCSSMTKHLDDFAKSHPGIAIIVVSADLPFAQKRFCLSKGVHHAKILSMMRNKDFGKAWGVLIADGPLAGILARSIVVLNAKDQVIYAELVAEITHEPDYPKALARLADI